MALLQSDHALDLLRGIVDRSPADQTEVTLESDEDSFLRYASSGPTQNADRERHQLSIRVRLSTEGERGAFGGWREARATCGTLDDDSIACTLQRALDLAEVAESNGSLVPMGGEVEVPESAAQRPTMDHTMGEKSAWISQALSSCEAQGLEAAGLAQTTTQSRTLVNSCGRTVHGARSRAASLCRMLPVLQGRRDNPRSAITARQCRRAAVIFGASPAVRPAAGPGQGRGAAQVDP